GGDDRDGLAGGDLGVEAVEEPHVVVGDEDVHEAAQRALLVEEPLAEAGVGGLEVLDDLGERLALDLDLRGTGGEGAQRGGDTDGGAHGAPRGCRGSGAQVPLTCDGRAARTAPIVGSIVAVDPCGGTSPSGTTGSAAPVTTATIRWSGRTAPEAARSASAATTTPVAGSPARPSRSARRAVAGAIAASSTASTEPPVARAAAMTASASGGSPIASDS